MRFAPALPLVSTLGLIASGASAQAVLDVGCLRDLGDAEVVTTDRAEVGEIETVLIDTAGDVVAVVVELDGFIGIGDEEIVFALSELVSGTATSSRRRARLRSKACRATTTKSSRLVLVP